MKKQYRLPDGTTTTDQKIYFDTWDYYTEKFVSIMGWKGIIGFDPGYLFDIDGKNSVDLPHSVVRKMVELAEKNGR